MTFQRSEARLSKARIVLALVAACAAAVAATASRAAADPALVAAATKEGRVVVYSVLSTKAALPLTADFQALYPGIRVDYDGDKGSTEMDARYRSESAAGTETADVVWSSAMDMQMQLVADGFAATYRSPEAAALPAWANYRDQAYGSTLEPVVIVYNKQKLPAADLPRDHAALAALLQREPERYRAKVTSFDIAKSGVGYMFAAQDAAASSGHGALLKALGGARLQASGGTGDMLTGINEGTYLLGYNMMGAYAITRSKKDLPNLGVVFPSDYTLVLSRVAFVSRRAAHPNAARLWLDYLLSPRGQAVLGNALELYPIREGVQAEFTAAQLTAAIGKSLRPIPLDMRLTEPLREADRARLLGQWRDAMR